MPSNGSRWKSRIIREEIVDASTLVDNPVNWRIHPPDQQRALAAVLDSVGWVQRIIVNERTGHVVDGHLRAALATERGEQIPVAFVDLDLAEEHLILATIDPVAGMAAADAEILEGLIADLRATPLVLDVEALGTLLTQVAESQGAVGIPTLSDLADQYGEHDDRHFWPVIRVQVPPETHELYISLCDAIPGEDDAEKMTRILEAVNAAALGV